MLMFLRLCSRAPLTEIESTICEGLAGALVGLIYQSIMLIQNFEARCKSARYKLPKQWIYVVRGTRTYALLLTYE